MQTCCATVRGAGARRRAAALCLAVLACAGAAAAQQPGRGPEIEPLVSGAAAYVEGTFVWTDYAYDDHGPDTQGGGVPTEADPTLAGGDAPYPASAAPGNAADLIQLQIGLRRRGGPPQRGVTVQAILETLVDPGLPLLAVAFDVDASSATGAFALPGSWVPGGRLGVEAALIVSAAGGEVWTWEGDAWITAARVPAVVDAERNVMQATLPRAIVHPGTATWRAFAAVGLAGPGGTIPGSWLDGASPVFDLGFVGGEPPYVWQDRRQADVLSGARAPGVAAAHIDFAKVARGVTELPDPLTPGFHTHLYRSQLRLGEGIATLANGTHQYNGPYQPYLVYVPPVLTEGRPISVFMHGSNTNHVQSVFLFPQGTYLGTGRALSEELHLIEQFVPDGTNFPPTVLTVYPFGRGETLGYVGAGEQDVLDVVDDAVRRFGSDPDRVTLSGASMGGFGAFRLGTLHPDRWAAVLPIIGYAPRADPGGSFALLGNLHNVPVRQVNGLIDFLIPAAEAEITAARLHELELDHRFWLLDNRHHEAGGDVYQCVYDQAQTWVRTRNPPRVVYRIDPTMRTVDPASGLDLRHDAAYWVSGLRVRDGAPWGAIDVTTHALPRHERLLTEVNARFSNLVGGRDLCGPDPAVPPTIDTWRELAWVVGEGAVLPPTKRLEATLASLSAVTFDLARAGFDEGMAGTLALTTDTPIVVRLTGLRRNQGVRGAESPGKADRHGVASITVPPGEHELRLVGWKGGGAP